MKVPGKIFLFFIALLFSAPAMAQAGNDLFEWNLKGKVNTVTAQEWITHDSAGKTISKKRIMGFGLFGHTTKFDTAGYIVSSTAIDSTKGKSALYKTYNALHEVTSSTHLHTDGSKTITKYVYESLGGNRLQYTEGEKGRTLSMSHTKDEQNRITESKVYSGDTLLYTTQYTYDADGNISGMTTENADKRKEVWGWKWKNGIKVQAMQTTYNNGVRKSVTNCLYDNAGNVVRKVEVFGKGEQHSTMYKYTFDSKGNWVTRQMQVMQGSSILGSYYAERVISYFD